MRKMHLKQPVNNVHKKDVVSGAVAAAAGCASSLRRKSRPTFPPTMQSPTSVPSPPVDSSFHDAIWPGIVNFNSNNCIHLQQLCDCIRMNMFGRCSIYRSLIIVCNFIKSCLHCPIAITLPAILLWGASLAAVLAVAQFFGMMPMMGVCRLASRAGAKSTGNSQASFGAKALHFRWCSVRVVWAMLYLVCGTVLTGLYAKRLQVVGVTAKNLGGAIYFCTSLTGSWIFFRMARIWPKLAAQWERTEQPFLRPPYQRHGRLLLSTKIRMTAFAFSVLTLCDYLIFSMQSVFKYMQRLEECHWADSQHLQRFFTLENLFIFDTLPFSLPAAGMKVIIDVINVVGASYGNIFVMLTCLGLSTRFRQIGERLERISDNKIPESTWAEVRMHYVQLCELLEAVNITLAPLILLSCANNLYFICVQILNIFDALDSLMDYMYFWFSLLYLVARTSGLFLYAGNIYDASWAPMEVIRRVPSADWGNEVERFCQQIICERPAMTGMRFFCLTRKNLLTMAATIVTYEVVLMQFAESTKAREDKIDAALSSCAMWVDMATELNTTLIDNILQN